MIRKNKAVFLFEFILLYFFQPFLLNFYLKKICMKIMYIQYNKNQNSRIL